MFRVHRRAITAIIDGFAMLPPFHDMSDVLIWTLAFSLGGGVLSVLAAGLFGLGVSSRRVPVLISFAIGALLGAAFLDVLPQAFAAQQDPQRTAAVVLAGILGFFVLEKLVLWRHCHEDHCEGHDGPIEDAGGARAGVLITLGDTVHNFVDGVLIAAAFSQSTAVGVVAATAMIAHEIPQEVGDFMILLHSGFTRARALAFNLLSSLATAVGGVLGVFAFAEMQYLVPYFLALAAASMIYVAVADLIPGLHRRPELAATAQQVALIACGIGVVHIVHELAEYGLAAG